MITAVVISANYNSSTGFIFFINARVGVYRLLLLLLHYIIIYRWRFSFAVTVGPGEHYIMRVRVYIIYCVLVYNNKIYCGPIVRRYNDDDDDDETHGRQRRRRRRTVKWDTCLHIQCACVSPNIIYMARWNTHRGPFLEKHFACVFIIRAVYGCACVMCTV